MDDTCITHGNSPVVPLPCFMTFHVTHVDFGPLLPHLLISSCGRARSGMWPGTRVSYECAGPLEGGQGTELFHKTATDDLVGRWRAISLAN